MGENRTIQDRLGKGYCHWFSSKDTAKKTNKINILNLKIATKLQYLSLLRGGGYCRVPMYWYYAVHWLTVRGPDSTVRRAVSSEGEREGSPWRDGAWIVAVVLSDSNRWPAGGRCRPMTLSVSVCRGGSVGTDLRTISGSQWHNVTQCWNTIMSYSCVTLRNVHSSVINVNQA